jgi:glucosamine-6-phosphate deaminase
MKAKRIVIMGFTETKAPIIVEAVEGAISSEVPATFL